MPINVICRTNLDTPGYPTWPTVMAAIPRIGDYVQAIDSLYRLKVCSITHSVKINRGELDPCESPIVLVELNR